ncbi:MAG: DUF4340 domain-containing protein [Planctomycetota bacterium]|nr:DUF4340 domain-containing protein [Planctomycetota bacterium]
MKPKTLVVLAAISGASALAAFLAFQSKEASQRSPASGTTGTPLLPALKPRINEVASITLRKANSEARIERRDGTWVVANRGGYPAKFEMVKQGVTQLADAKIIDAKTSNKERYAAIGVQEPDAPDAGSTLVRFADAKGETIASLIVGKAETGPAAADAMFGGAATGKMFVRRAGEAQAFLADLNAFNAEADPMQWITREFLKMPRERMQGVTIVHPGGEQVVVSRDSKDAIDFTLQNMAAGRELSYAGAATNVASALDFVSLEDVKPAAEIDLSKEPGPVATFRTFDGVLITARTGKVDGKDWVAFQASLTPEAAAPPRGESQPEAGQSDGGQPKTGPTRAELEAEVAELNAKLSPWVFVVGDFKHKQLAATMESLLKPVEGGAEPGSTSVGPSVDSSLGPVGPSPAPEPGAAPAPEPALTPAPNSDTPEPINPPVDPPKLDPTPSETPSNPAARK